MTSLRLASTLPVELEVLARDTIGALLSVHRELGSGLSEAVYGAAIRIELSERGISFDSEKAIPVPYKVEELDPAHVAQVVSYLRLTGSRLGLLVNFNVPLLKQGLRRIVL